MEIVDIQKYVNDNMLDNIYKEREDTISEVNEEDKEELAKIKEKYPIDYEKLLEYINNLPPQFNNIRENLLNSIDIYSMRDNLISAYHNEKFYKIGFCDGIRTIIESVNTNSNKTNN